MRSFTIFFCCALAVNGFSQNNARKTFLITAGSGTPLVYDRLCSMDLSSGKKINDLFESSGKNYAVRNNSYKGYEKEREGHEANPLGGSVACAAFDAKTNRLFYIPLQLSELRYMDLKEQEPSFTCLQNQSLNLLHSKEDVANQVSRMTIGADGFGYALTNDGEHLIRFSTQGNPVIQDLGVLIDNPSNKVLVRSSCTSWGGDMVGAADGSLYLITLHNHVFRISLPTKKCDYIGTIKNLPEEFTSNGASVDEKGNLLISCGTSYGKRFSPVYQVQLPSLEATAVEIKDQTIGNISDMASSNLLFQQPAGEGKKETGIIAFSQTLDADDNQLPSVRIFPNPVNRGRFQVKTNNLTDKGDYRIIILDVNGKGVFEGKMNVSGKTSTHNFSFPAHQAKGVYFLQISDMFNRNVYTQQLIVE